MEQHRLKLHAIHTEAFVYLIYPAMEDAFAGLMLVDPEDERPEMTSREARIARAFAESKENYSSEIVVMTPGVR